MQIIKLFNGSTETDLETGTKILIKWESFIPKMENAVFLRPYEFVKGWIINEDGLEVVVAQKPGRKVTTKADE